MSIKISELPAAAAINAADVLCIVQGAETKKAAVSLLPQPTIPVEVPTGSLLMFAGAAAPSGWLLCDGAAVSRTTYAALFAAISTTYGVGNGSTTFNVPDLCGRSPLGAGTGAGLTARTLGAIGGEQTHQLTDAELPASQILRNTGATAGLASGSYITVGVIGSGAAHNTMHPFLVVNFIIKT